MLQEDIHTKGYVKDYETTLQRPDGTIRHCIMTASARYDEQGNLQGYEGILRDITEEKKRQQATRSFQKQLQEEIVLAEERERRHTGQILHEEMAQSLALVNMKLREAEQQLKTLEDAGESTGDITRQLTETQELITLMISQIRTMIFDLFPIVLDDQGLVPAMVWYGDHFTRRTGINVSVYGVSGSLGLAESQKIYLFRSFKELLHNAWKHADTKEIVASVKKTDNHIRLTVDDEGCGFDQDKNTNDDRELRGIGLVSIRQWVTAMEGTMSIESEPGKGSRVTIDIPITEGGVT
jgi:two-component system sensor histidine kinase DegS